jgi:hypothetical protein
MFYGKPTRLQVRISPVFTPRRTDAVGQAPFEEEKFVLHSNSEIQNKT